MIPKNLQMAFSEAILQNYLDIVTKRNQMNDIDEIAKFVAVVDTPEEADAINLQIISQRPLVSSNQTHNLGSGYGSEEVPVMKKIEKLKMPDTNSDEYEEEDDVQSLHHNQKSFSPPIGYEIIGDMRRISRLS